MTLTTRAPPLLAPGRLRAVLALAGVALLAAAALRRRSLAHYVRPRPAALQPAEPFVDNIEAPVRYARPGEAEVKWPELLFGS